MAHRPATSLNPAKIDLLRKALTVAPMTLDLTGLSMYPAIRAGDRCRVVAVKPATLKVGDVVLSTRESRLYAHRVVAIETGPPVRWVVKGDTLLIPDPPVFVDDILGQVVGIERKGTFRDLRSSRSRVLGLLIARVSAPYSVAFVRAMLLRRRILARLASIPAWRARRRSRLRDVVIRPATPEDIDGIAMLFGEQVALHTPMGGIDMDEVRGQAQRMMAGSHRAGATLWLALVDGFVSGHAVVGPLGEGGPQAPGWWVMSVYVKMTARGCGLAERLVVRGLEEAAARGIAEVRYAAFADNVASLRLAEKLGFKQETSDIADAFAQHYSSMGARRRGLVVTRKDLTIDAG